MKINVKSLGTGAGTVPPDQARHLVTTFGILGSVFSGIGGVVLTLHIAPRLGGLALAELVLALAAAVLIAACGRHQGDRKNARVTEGENMLSSGPGTCVPDEFTYPGSAPIRPPVTGQLSGPVIRDSVPAGPLPARRPGLCP